MMSQLPGFGQGQTVQDVSGSRVFGTTYYNTTSKPIQLVQIRSSLTATLTINGVACASTSGGSDCQAAVVQVGESYSVASGGTMTKWLERR